MRSSGMELAHRVGPALLRRSLWNAARDLGPEQRVVDPALRLVDVELGRHDVVVAGQDDRRPCSSAASRRSASAARTRSACSRTSAPAPDCRSAGRGSRSATPLDGGLDVAAVQVVRIARQAAPRLDRLRAPREDRDAVPALLAVPDRAVARVARSRAPGTSPAAPSAPAGRRRRAWPAPASAAAPAAGR